MFLDLYKEWMWRDTFVNKGTSTISATSYLPALLTYEIITKSDKERVENKVTSEEKNVELFHKTLPGRGSNGVHAMIHILTEQRETVFAEWLIEIAKQKGLTINVEEWLEKFDAKYSQEDPARDIDVQRKQSSIWFDVKTPTNNFTGRRTEMEQLHTMIQTQLSPDVISKKQKQFATVVAGLGGVGKTQLVSRYVENHAKDYRYNVVWINSENLENLHDSFYRLAEEELGIGVSAADVKKKNIKSVVKEVYKWFQGKRCLFVFDNAEQLCMDNDGCGISDFLPEKNPRGTSPYIVITSRNQKWGDFNVLQLSPLNIEEASEFIKTGLNITDDSEDEAVSDLANTLQNLPLALQQAVSYIQTTNEESSYVDPQKRFTIRNYLEMYEATETALLLKHKFPNYTDNFNVKPTFITWQTTVDKLKNMKTQTADFGLHLLNICAFCAPQKIPVQLMFLKLANNNDRLLGASVSLLNQYSLVNADQGYVSVHRLIQQVTRLAISEQEREKNVIPDVYAALHGNFPTGNSTAVLKVRAEFRPHLETASHLIKEILQTKQKNKEEESTLWKDCLIPLMCDVLACYYRSKDPKEMQRFQRVTPDVEKQYGSSLVNMATTLRTTFRLGYHPKTIEVLESTLPTLEKHSGSDHFRLALTFSTLGKVCADFGDSLKEKQLNDRALAILEKHYGTDHFDMGTILVPLGNVYGTSGVALKKKELLEKALSIQEKRYGCGHFALSSILANLGVVYAELGNFQKQKEVLERALPIKEKHYCPDHYEIALSLLNLGNAYGDLGDPQKKIELFENALPIVEKKFDADRCEVATLLVHLANAYGSSGDSGKKQELLDKSLSMREKHYVTVQYEVASTLTKLGATYSTSGNPQKQNELIEKTLEILENNYGCDHFDIPIALVALCMTNVVSQEHQKKEFAERTLMDENLDDAHKRIEVLETSLATLEKHFGPDHYQVATVLVSLAHQYGGLGDTQKQNEVCDRAVAILEKCDGFEVVTTLVTLSTVYDTLGDVQKTKELFEKVLEILEKSQYEPSRFEAALRLAFLRIAFGNLGDVQKKELLERVLILQEKHYGSDHVEVARTFVNLSNAYGALGDLQKKKELLERALAIQEKHLGSDHAEVAGTLSNLGNIYYDLNDHSNAKMFKERSTKIFRKVSANVDYKAFMKRNNIP